MTGFAPRIPTNDEALDILRRIEPVLSGITNRLDGIDKRLDGLESRVARVEEDLHRQGEAILKMQDTMIKIQIELGELRGRVTRLPTLYQLATLIFAIFGASFVQIRFASGR